MKMRLLHLLTNAFIVFFVWISFGNSSVGQETKEIDSLKVLLRSEKLSPEQILICEQLHDAFAVENPDSALQYALIGLNISTQIEDRSKISLFHKKLGDTYADLNKSETSEHHYLKALLGYQAANDSLNLVSTYRKLGYLMAYSNNQHQSLQYYLNAFDVAQALQDSMLLIDLYYNIGTFYEYLPNFEMARIYYEKTAAFEQAIQNFASLASTFATLAYIHAQTQAFQQAEVFAAKSLALLRDYNDPFYQTFTYSVMADYYIVAQQTDSAKKYIDLTEALAAETNDRTMRADVYKQKGELALILGNFRQSIIWLDKSIEAFEKDGNPEPLRQIYQKKSEAYIGLGQFERAHRALEVSNLYVDSLNLRDVARMLGTFEQDQLYKTELRNLELQQEVERHEAQHTIFQAKRRLFLSYASWGFIVVVILISIPFVMAVHRKNKKLNEQNSIIIHQKQKLEENLNKLHQREADLLLANETKDKFFSIIAHDLKNPFNTLIGYSDLLLEDKDLRHSEDFERIAIRLNKSAEKGYDLLTNLLKWAQSQTGDLRFNPYEHSIQEVVEKNIRQVNETAKAKGLNITFEVEEDFRVLLDADMMDTVVRNLLTNAIKFSYPEKEIRVSVRKNGHGIITSVQDFGVGMNSDELGLLFNYGSKIQKSGTQNEPGSGLGLILCKEFLEYHQGKIWAECNDGEGCTFAFWLPFKN